VLGDRECAAARELTTLHEEIVRGALSEVRRRFTEQPPRGEFTLVVAGQAAESGRWDEARLQAAIAEARRGSESPSQAARRLASESGWPRSEVYKLLQGK
jgi:16S rRNA (cytidine1402-2'-O)-methyltransferase